MLIQPVCRTCCQRYRRVLLGSREECGWWNQEDEARWQEGVVRCPMNLARTMGDHVAWLIDMPAPRWCPFAAEHIIMEAAGQT